MTRYYLQYKKSKKKNIKKIMRLLSIIVFIGGVGISAYVFFPLILWQMYFSPVFASQNITSPIPKTTIVSPTSLKSLISEAKNAISGVDYTDAKNWFPGFNPLANSQPKLPFYTISIPAIQIKNAIVSTIDNDLTHHLVNYQGTSIPSENGNAVIFGHSTLPQLFNPNDYKTIFANAYKLKAGDKIRVSMSGADFSYNIYNITVVDPNDTSALSQVYDNSYITLVTCTPPGTVWKRLIIKARLEKI